MTRRPAVAVVGSGGIGSKFAALLADEADVVVFHRRPDYLKAVNERGLEIVVDDRSRFAKVRASADPVDLNAADAVLFAVKSYDTGATLSQIAEHLRPDSVVFTLQNGLGNAEAIAGAVGLSRTGMAVTTEGATLVAPGVVSDKGRGITYLGMLAPSVAQPPGFGPGELSALLNAVGLRAEVRQDILGLLWAKLAMAAGINPVAVALRLPNGKIGEIPEVRRLSYEAITEVMDVARAREIDLAFDPIAAFDTVTKATSVMLSGSLLDILRGRRTEIDAIAGAVSREAASLGVQAPVNTVLAMLVQALEASSLDRVPEQVHQE